MHVEAVSRIAAARAHTRRANPRALSFLLLLAFAGSLIGASAQTVTLPAPPDLRSHQKFLALRRGPRRSFKAAVARPRYNLIHPAAQATPSSVWQPLGPQAVISANYGLVSGRVTSLALDPSDPTGNTLYVGTTGGGVWISQNAAASTAGNVAFTPLTDNVSALVDVTDASISIGALSVQPGGTGVLLAGTGDSNDALDSYYGAGILRSTDHGNSWSLVQQTNLNDGAGHFFGFLGEGFAGFAWGTSDPNFVVAAVSQAYEGQLVDAEQSNFSYTGLYYSRDAGASWNLARITDGNDQDVQGPVDGLVGDGNPATAVVWNPIRNLFIAAVRFHGYYQSSDGITWTRLANQPNNTALSTTFCPTNSYSTGSSDCPILRGALAVNPLTGDTFAWTVDLYNQDIGIWQDVCAASGGRCSNQTITFSKEWSTTQLESSSLEGAATIANGDYNLTLAALPSGQDTILLAGANDLWKCSLSMGCTWRNTTNSTTCMSAKVGEYQHSLAWNPSNSQELFVGNDSGLWRSKDAIGEDGSTCASSDATHVQNLNGSIGSLAEAESISQVTTTPYTAMAALGANGTAGVKSTTGPTSHWPQILGGEGGPVAIDPSNPDKWYVNNSAGVSIHLCDSPSPCMASDFGTQPVVSDADVASDGLTMAAPAPFLVDPADPSQLLVGTCRVWRGPADGSGWTSANAVSPMLDGNRSSSYCNGNALIRSMAAQALPGGGEVVYIGTYSRLNGGGTLPGHVLTATMNPQGVWSSWRDLTASPVTNNIIPFNEYRLDISSLTIDSHDTTGNTVYVTVAGIPDAVKEIAFVYRSTDGGAHWTTIDANLPLAPANAVAVDPVDANTVYLASDLGVYSTRQVASCATTIMCWAPFGAGLPQSPVTALSAAPAGASPSVLVAATYGRGLWQIPLLTAGTPMTTASASPVSLAFPDQPENSASAAQAITLTNTGAFGFAPSITINGDFGKVDNCTNQVVNVGASCAIDVTFTPQSLGARSGQLTIAGNLSGGSIVVNLSGVGIAPTGLQLVAASNDFGLVEEGLTSAALAVSVQNATASAINVSSIRIPAPFLLSSDVCGSVIAANTSCQLKVEFKPTASGPASGLLTVIDDGGTQTLLFTGNGTAPPTDVLSAATLSFPSTVVGSKSTSRTITLSNTGGNPLSSIAVSVSGPFQQSNNCTTQLAAEQSCSISVAYQPTAAGAQNGTVTVADILRTQSVSLAGTGVLPAALTATPTSLNFGNQQPSLPAAPQIVTLTNGGSSPVQGLIIEISPPFSLAQNACGTTLAAGAACSLGVVFTPAQTGNFIGVLTIVGSSLKSPATVPLSGVGFDFAISTSGPPSQTVASGATATYQLALTPSQGTAATFRFLCNSLPSYASCAFDPPENTVAANSTGTEIVQISTSQSTSSKSEPTGSHGLAAMLLACGIVLLPFGRRSRRWLFGILAAVAFTAFVSCCSSSGGGAGSSPASSSNKTPAGTYSIPVVVSSGSSQHTVTLTLVVD